MKGVNQSRDDRAVGYLATTNRTIIFCTIALLVIGIILVLSGISVLFIDHADLRPPHFDNEYERYDGSSLAHIIGLLFIISGILLIAGTSCMIAYATNSYYSHKMDVRFAVARATSA